MLGPNGKRKWWVLGLVAVCLLVLSGAGGGRQALAPAVDAAEAATTAGSAALWRTMEFPAHSMSYDPAGSTISPGPTGLLWKKLGGGGYLTLARPADWDGESVIQIRILFSPMTDTAGTVRFFVRPRVYNPGDTFRDVAGVNSNLVTVSGNDKYYQMTVTIPAASFGTKAWWFLVFQRDSTSTPTYPDDVMVYGVTVEYTALSPLSSVALPVVSRQQ